MNYSARRESLIDELSKLEGGYNKLKTNLSSQAQLISSLHKLMLEDYNPTTSDFHVVRVEFDIGLCKYIACSHSIEHLSEGEEHANLLFGCFLYREIENRDRAIKLITEYLDKSAKDPS